MVPQPVDRPRNRLLTSLPATEFARLRPHLVPVPLVPHETLLEIDRPLSRLWFVEDGLVSLIAGKEGGEVGMIGRDGVIGLAALLRQPTATVTAVVHMPGSALAVPVEPFVGLLPVLPACEHLLLGEAQAAFVERLQATACRAKHTVLQRLAKSVLLASARSGRAELPVTHDFLARLLGIRRASVTDVIHILEGEKIIRSTWKSLVILDQAGLGRISCGCHDVVDARRDPDHDMREHNSGLVLPAAPMHRGFAGREPPAAT